MLRVKVLRRATGFGLAVALAILPSATCLLGAEASRSEMACCAAMGHDCGQTSVDKDCCAAVPAPSALSILASLIAQLTPPPPVVVSIIAQPGSAALDLFLGDSNTSKSPSRPTYLFDSVFRL